MEKGTRVCKVCGKEYPYCVTARHDGAFRWQDVACCPEHGSTYFAAIAASRAPKTTSAKKSTKATKATKVVEPVEPELEVLSDEDTANESDEVEPITEE